jgi:hypothetical protein
MTQDEAVVKAQELWLRLANTPPGLSTDVLASAIQDIWNDGYQEGLDVGWDQLMQVG